MWFFRPSRRWDWLQVEVSSQCPAACIYCPTALFRKGGSNLLMSMETYHRLLPAFSRTRMVFLQGWGEPFLNPHLFEMVRQAKSAGCQVGTTTNGMLLDTDKLAGLVNSGMDMVAFSLAGCSETNDSVRKGTRLAHVLEAIRQLNRIKENERTARPVIHIAYMLLRSGLDEIEQLPSLLAGFGSLPGGGQHPGLGACPRAEPGGADPVQPGRICRPARAPGSAGGIRKAIGPGDPLPDGRLPVRRRCFGTRRTGYDRFPPRPPACLHRERRVGRVHLRRRGCIPLRLHEFTRHFPIRDYGADGKILPAADIRKCP